VDLERPVLMALVRRCILGAPARILFVQDEEALKPTRQDFSRTCSKASRIYSVRMGLADFCQVCGSAMPNVSVSCGRPIPTSAVGIVQCRSIEGIPGVLRKHTHVVADARLHRM
jgi:hypothetical protein